MDNVTVWAAFVAGIASFITPCVLPMVPVYLASLAGPEILEGRSSSRWPLFLHALSFVLGMGLVFTLTGALVGLVGININPNSQAVQKISGGLLIFFGLVMLAAGFIPWLNFEKRLSPKAGQSSSYIRSFIVGASFTIAWSPCYGPILGSVLTIAGTSETAGKGALLLAVYSLGLGLPFLLIGAFFSTLTPLLKRIGRFSRWIYFASGALLVIAGILILLGKISFLYFNNW
jgi:cytochrome c-type biogenesis protein